MDYNKLARALLEQGSLNSMINSSQEQAIAPEPLVPLQQATGDLIATPVPASSAAIGPILDQLFLVYLQHFWLYMV